MFEHFEKGDEIEDFIGMLRAERFQRKREKAAAGAKAPRKSSRRGIEFDASGKVARVGGSTQKITGAAADVEEAATARSKSVGKEEVVTRFEGKDARIAPAIHRGIQRGSGILRGFQNCSRQPEHSCRT